MCLAACCSLEGRSLAGEPGQDVDPGERYPERLVYNAESGEWVAEVRPEPGTADGDLALARNLLARGEYKQASKRLREWIRIWSLESARHPEAVFLLGRAEFELRNFMRAHARYQEVLNAWPGTEWADQALRGDFVIAEVFLAGQRRKILGMPLVRAYEEAIEILDDIIVNHPQTALAQQALKTKADYYYRTGEMSLAEDTYAQLARDFPAGQYAREAMLQSARAALASFPGIKYDDATLIEAEERFVQFRRAFPQNADDEDIDLTLESIQSKRAEKEFAIAAYYERIRKLDAAAFYYRVVQNNWPDTTWAQEADACLARLGQMPDDPAREFELANDRAGDATDGGVPYDEP